MTVYDPHQLMQIPPLTRAEIGNLLVAANETLKLKGLDAGTLVALADKLASAQPLPPEKPEAEKPPA